MRAIGSIITVVLAVTLLPGPAWAGSHINVENEEYPGETLKVRADDCESGPGFEAFVEVELVDPPDVRIVKERKRADDDGETKVKVKIPTDTEPGRYLAIVTCKHLFDEGGFGIFYVSEEPFRVLAG